MTIIPAGYYPDPAGGPQQRWWNGSSWSDSMQPAPNPYNPAQPFGSVQPYDPAQSYYAQNQLSAPEGTNPTTTFAWVIAFWPLIGLLDLAFTWAYLLGNVGSYDMNNLISNGITFAAWLGMVGVAYADYRELQRRQVPKPFHWAWAFLGIVYVIGRAVVVHRRTRRGLAPLFVWIGAVVLNWIIGVVIGITLSMSIVNSNY